LEGGGKEGIPGGSFLRGGASGLGGGSFGGGREGALVWCFSISDFADSTGAGSGSFFFGFSRKLGFPSSKKVKSDTKTPTNGTKGAGCNLSIVR